MLGGCTKLGFYAQHNDLRDEFAALCIDAGLAVDLEKGPNNRHPMDVLVHSIDNSPLAVDFSVVHPITQICFYNVVSRNVEVYTYKSVGRCRGMVKGLLVEFPKKGEREQQQQQQQQ